jgi:hypothetical protein
MRSMSCSCERLLRESIEFSAMAFRDWRQTFQRLLNARCPVKALGSADDLVLRLLIGSLALQLSRLLTRRSDAHF